MGCSQSQLCTCTLSQSVAEPSDDKPSTIRRVAVDPAKASEAAVYKESAIAAAQRLLDANKAANWRDTYVRATLVSYGGSSRVFSAVNKYTNQPVAVKTITKVRCLVVQLRCVVGRYIPGVAGMLLLATALVACWLAITA